MLKKYISYNVCAFKMVFFINLFINKRVFFNKENNTNMLQNRLHVDIYRYKMKEILKTEISISKKNIFKT